VTAVTQGAKGTVAINASQTVTYTAGLFVGTDTFTYTVSDGAGGTATATVTVTVTAPPRVTTNLQVRYDFNEGSGSTVNDTSVVGAPYNLSISAPGAVSWLPGALSVNRHGCGRCCAWRSVARREPRACGCRVRHGNIRASGRDRIGERHPRREEGVRHDRRRW